MNTNLLVEKLKDNNEDFEFYPTTKSMIETIYHSMDNPKSILDIGCGTCNFLKHIDDIEKDKEYKTIFNYFVIEKSKILIDMLDKRAMVLGTDFNTTLLIDKPVDVIFCNPPYSQYIEWTKRIIFEGNYKECYLIIPDRWKDNKEILQLLKDTDVIDTVIGSFDFLDAERKARAKVDILKIKKRGYNYKPDDINEQAFNVWFNETFEIDKRTDKVLNETEKTENIKNQLISTKSGKANMLVDFYNSEIEELFRHFKAITSLDSETLDSIGVDKKRIKESLKQKTKTLKIRYWKIVFDELEDITKRLTVKSRKKLWNKFELLQTVEFSLNNIYPLILWVIKNANVYYNDQLIDFYKRLSSIENVKPYKSNQKVFEKDAWRFRNSNPTHYTLDYRIICSSLFSFDYSWLRLDKYKTSEVINDICAIANNLGFTVGDKETPDSFGTKYYIRDLHGKELIEFKVFKNRNTHIKLNIELAKAINVEVSRLLGWIRSVDDIKNEFPEELAKGAEKYFKSNLNIIGSGDIKLLT